MTVKRPRKTRAKPRCLNCAAHREQQAIALDVIISLLAAKPSEHWGLINALERELVELSREVRSWMREFNMYRSAWLREIGGVIRLKAHEIDGFVLRTRDLKESADRATEADKALASYFQSYHTHNAELRAILEAAHYDVTGVRYLTAREYERAMELVKG